MPLPQGHGGWSSQSSFQLSSGAGIFVAVGQKSSESWSWISEFPEEEVA